MALVSLIGCAASPPVQPEMPEASPAAIAPADPPSDIPPAASNAEAPAAFDVASAASEVDAAIPPVLSGAIAQQPGIQQTILAENLEHPWGIAWLPNGDMLVTERPGRLRIIRNGRLDPTPIPGVPPVLAVGQGGLLDIALHPQFAENRWVYFTYAHGAVDANQTRVARAQFDGTRLTNWTVLFEVNRAKTQGQHFGSRLAWLPDNTLLVSIGDGGNPPVQLDGDLIRNQAQNLNVHLGKIVRLNDDGSIPVDNPFVNTPNAEPSIWSYGHRNIQGLAFDPETQRVWSTEHGSRGGDELNLIAPGKNYGWPVVTFSREYSGGVISSEQSRPGMVDPRLVWTPATAPSGLAIYRGDRFPEWQGKLFAGGLVSQDVRQIEVDEAGRVVNESSIPIGQRVRDVRQGPDGYLYVLTDAPNGRLIRLGASR
ncbi:PQQ-dependent sugar dehydrogenase [Thermoleptolyngbya sp. C42_A2020_037]|uniref:PQQ-dependent sugar dehydrogenase n=1 Tax=Thermoleptolyngbya sp. C42_A2020_037 TaxID=2747799 RepID=UPI0025F63132|nr:PQQ-dependent sugar dehydrogenase [Thermoleptolyngbya sp. C42_A2020_037]